MWWEAQQLRGGGLVRCRVCLVAEGRGCCHQPDLLLTQLACLVVSSQRPIRSFGSVLSLVGGTRNIKKWVSLGEVRVECG